MRGWLTGVDSGSGFVLCHSWLSAACEPGGDFRCQRDDQAGVRFARRGCPGSGPARLSSARAKFYPTSGWHFIYPDRVIGVAGWKFRRELTHGAPDATYREPNDLPVPLLPNGVTCAIRVEPRRSAWWRTEKRVWFFGLAELNLAGRLTFLDGDAAAVYTPPTRSLTLGEASQHDFPSVAAHGDRAYAAWVTYQNEGNFVYLAVREEYMDSQACIQRVARLLRQRRRDRCLRPRLRGVGRIQR